MSRRYTLDQLDEMRVAIRSTHIHSNALRSINEEVEDKLKTYLIAGIEPQELIDRMKMISDMEREVRSGLSCEERDVEI